MRETFTRWTCNVCSAQEEAASGQPEGWVGYGFTNPGTPAGEHKVLGHLCRECAARIGTAMTPEDSTPQEGHQ
jgi:hypothetical protein